MHAVEEHRGVGYGGVLSDGQGDGHEGLGMPSKAGNPLGQQRKQTRFAKARADYEKQKPKVQAGWPDIVTKLSEAARFQTDFAAAVQALPAA
jgi:hypothetical protein